MNSLRKRHAHKNFNTMDRNRNNILNMYLAVQLVIAKFILKWTGYTPFETANTEFNGLVDDIKDVNELQKVIIKGYTKEKREKKRAMANLGVILAKKVRALASAKSNYGLFGEMNITFSKLFYMRSNLSIAFAKQVLASVNGMSPEERTAYDISAENISSFSKAIDDFEVVNALPREKIALRKTESKKLSQLFKNTTAVLKDKLDNLMENFVTSDTDFYSDYKNARAIVNFVRHTAIAANVTAVGGEDLKKVKVTLTGKDKVTNAVYETFEELTDKDGNMIKRELNPEYEWDVKFELPAYEPVEVRDIDLSPGKHEKLEVVLKKI